jgi:hemoglobin-like flavoprotein
MPTSESETFRASLSRCLLDNAFLRDFYQLLMASSAAVREKFKNTDFPRQTRVLADSLYIMAVASESKDDAVAWRELDRLADLHSRSQLDIRPDLYVTWLDCLVKAASQHDPEFSPEIGEAWRQALTPGIEYLSARY